VGAAGRPATSKGGQGAGSEQQAGSEYAGSHRYDAETGVDGWSRLVSTVPRCGAPKWSARRKTTDIHMIAGITAPGEPKMLIACSSFHAK
jgi:hypothetical protein